MKKNLMQILKESNENVKAKLSSIKALQENESYEAKELLETKNKAIEILNDELFKIREELSESNEQFDIERNRLIASSEIEKNDFEHQPV